MEEKNSTEIVEQIVKQERPKHMKAKEYLQELRRLDTIIKQKKQEKADLRTMATSAGSFDYTKERVQTSPSGDAPFVNPVHSLIELEKEIDREIEAFAAKKHEIINQIHGLRDPMHIEILYKRYVEFKSLETVAQEMGYTYQYAREIHGTALQEFKRTYKNLQTSYKIL